MTDIIKPLAYYATLEHAQWILGMDGQYLDQIGKCRNLQAASRMMRDYNVARTIWGKNGLRNLAQAVFDKLEHETWPDNLMARARWCASIAEDHSGQQSTKGNRKQGAPYSAVTKLCWFLHPVGWTMYDRFARLGLTGLKGANGTERFTSFYDALDRTGFSDKLACINEVIEEELGPNALYAERIIDKFLMMRGKIWSLSDDEARADEIGQLTVHNQLFLDNPLILNHTGHRSLGSRIDRLATKVSEVLPNDSFMTSHVEMQLKKHPELGRS
ncbi:MAG: hypothetical protein R3E02_12005 [Blastomonas sp.]